MIIGIGTDIVEIERMAEVMRRTPRFMNRILTEVEFSQLPESERRRLEFLCGRFAAKEAFAKALGVGIGASLSWKDISIAKAASGKPEIVYHHTQFHTTEWENRKTHVTITHERKYILAFVIIEEG